MSTLRDQILKQLIRESIERNQTPSDREASIRQIVGFLTAQNRGRAPTQAELNAAIEASLQYSIERTFETLLEKRAENLRKSAALAAARAPVVLAAANKAAAAAGLASAAASKMAAASEIKNHQEVLAEATYVLDLKTAVDDAEALQNLQLEGQNESVMDRAAMGIANAHFNNVILKNFSEAFWAYSPFGPQKRNKETQEICVQRILLQVRKCIFDQILKNTFETPRVKEWLRRNGNILLTPNHPNYEATLIESRQYLNEKNNHRHAAWRNFDEGAPLESCFHRMFLPTQKEEERIHSFSVAGTESNLMGQRNDCRLRLAYYFLVAIDPTQAKENIDMRISNLIDELYEITRAHNINTSIPRKQQGEDDPSCYPGTLGRLAQCGKYHPIAVLPSDPLTLLPGIFKEHVNDGLQNRFAQCRTYKEKIELFKALRDFENYDGTSKIARNKIEYSKALLDIRRQFLEGLGNNKFLFENVINLTLRAQRCPYVFSPTNIYHVSKLDLLRLNIWSFAYEDITRHFWQSLTTEECTHYRTESGEQPPAGIIDDPFSDQYCKMECAQLTKEVQEGGVAAIIATLDNQLATVREGFRIKKISWDILIKEGLDKKDGEEIANQLGDYLNGLKQQDEIKQRAEEILNRLPSSFMADRRMGLLKCIIESISGDNKKIAESEIKTDLAIIQAMAQEQRIKESKAKIELAKTQTELTQAQEKKEREIKVKKAAGELPRLERIGKLARFRLDFFVGRVAPCPEIDMPKAPFIHPFYPTGLDSRKRRYDSGLPTLLVTAQLPPECLRPLPVWINEFCEAYRVPLIQRKAFLVVQNGPWQDETLAFNPQTWLSSDAPSRGAYCRRTPVVMGVTDVHRSLDSTKVVKEVLETRGERDQDVRFLNNKQLAGIENFHDSHFLYSVCINSETQQAVITYHWLLNDSDYRDTKFIVEGLCRMSEPNINLRYFLSLMNGQSLSSSANTKGLQELENLFTGSLGSLGTAARPEVPVEAPNYRLVNPPSHVVAAAELVFKRTNEEQARAALEQRAIQLALMAQEQNQRAASAAMVDEGESAAAAGSVSAVVAFSGVAVGVAAPAAPPPVAAAPTRVAAAPVAIEVDPDKATLADDWDEAMRSLS